MYPSMNPEGSRGPQAVVGRSASWGVAEEMVEEGWEVSPG